MRNKTLLGLLLVWSFLFRTHGKFYPVIDWKDERSVSTQGPVTISLYDSFSTDVTGISEYFVGTWYWLERQPTALEEFCLFDIYTKNSLSQEYSARVCIDGGTGFLKLSYKQVGLSQDDYPVNLIIESGRWIHISTVFSLLSFRISIYSLETGTGDSIGYFASPIAGLSINSTFSFGSAYDQTLLSIAKIRGALIGTTGDVDRNRRKIYFGNPYLALDGYNFFINDRKGLKAYLIENTPITLLKHAKLNGTNSIGFGIDWSNYSEFYNSISISCSFRVVQGSTLDKIPLINLTSDQSNAFIGLSLLRNTSSFIISASGLDFATISTNSFLLQEFNQLTFIVSRLLNQTGKTVFYGQILLNQYIMNFSLADQTYFTISNVLIGHSYVYSIASYLETFDLRIFLGSSIVVSEIETQQGCMAHLESFSALDYFDQNIMEYCLICNSTSKLLNNSCINSCPDAFTSAAGDSICLPCPDGCSKCSESFISECLNCLPEYFLTASKTCIKKNLTLGRPPNITKVTFDPLMTRIIVSFDIPVYVQRFKSELNREDSALCQDIMNSSFISLLGDGFYCFLTGPRHNQLIIWLGYGPDIDFTTKINFLGNAVFSLESEVPMLPCSLRIDFPISSYHWPILPSKITLNMNQEELIPKFIYDPFQIFGDFEVLTCNQIVSDMSNDFNFEYLRLFFATPLEESCLSFISSTVFGLKFQWIEKISSVVFGEASFYQGAPAILLVREGLEILKSFEYYYVNVFSTLSSHYTIASKAEENIGQYGGLKGNEQVFSKFDFQNEERELYEIMFSATHPIQLNKDYLANTTISMISSPLEVVIINPPDQWPSSKGLRLEAYTSQREKTENITYSWYCKLNNSNCYNQLGQNLLGINNTEPILYIPQNSLISGYSYIFFVVASTQNISGVAKHEITVVDFDIKISPSIHSTSSEGLLSYFNDGGSYYFYTNDTQVYTYKWSCNLTPVLKLSYPNYQLIKIEIHSPSIKNYKLVLSNPIQNSSTSFSFAVNFPPSQGIFEVKPQKGLSLETYFELLADSWIDTDLPLTYEYFSTKFYYQNELKISFNDYSRVQRKITLLPYDNILKGCRVNLKVSDYYKSSTQVSIMVPLQSDLQTSTYSFITRVMASKANFDVFTYIQLISLGSFQLDSLFSERESNMTCSGHGTLNGNKCMCFEGWKTKICSISSSQYSDEQIIRNKITEFFISSLLNDFVLENSLVRNNYLTSLTIMTKFVEILDNNIRENVTSCLKKMLQAAKNESFPYDFENMRNTILISGNMLDQIELQCNDSPNKSVEIFSSNLENIRNTSKLIMKDHFVGKDEIVLLVPNLRLYSEKINIATLSNKTIYIDDKTPILRIGSTSTSQSQPFESQTSYDLEIIWWKSGLLDCIPTTKNPIQSDLFISITDKNDEPLSQKVPLDVLYPKKAYKSGEVKCNTELKCFLNGEVSFDGKEFYRCSCEDLRKFSAEEMLRQIITHANFDKLGNLESLLQYAFYRSATFYITLGLNLFLFSAMAWGYLKDKRQKRMRLLGKVTHGIFIQTQLQATKRSKFHWVKIIWEAIKVTHVLLSSFMLYDPYISRPKRFSIYLCRTMMLMAISALFYQGVKSASYSYLQNAMISIIQILGVSVYSLILGKLLHGARKRAQRLSTLTVEEIRDRVRQLFTAQETLRRFWKGCVQKLAVIFLIVPLITSYYFILVISASIDEESSNRWAVAFVVSWILDLFTFQIVKAVFNAVILAVAIDRESKTKRKSKWAYMMFAPQIIKKMRATVKPFVRRSL